MWARDARVVDLTYLSNRKRGNKVVVVVCADLRDVGHEVVGDARGVLPDAPAGSLLVGMYVCVCV